MEWKNALLSTNHCKSFSQLVEFQGSWYQFISISLFAIALYSCPQSVNDPWTTREPPRNHPGTTREPPVNHQWDQCVRDTKNWVRDPKNWLCTVSDPWNTRETPVKHPWNTREAPVKHPWSTREWSGDAQWTCINGQMVSIFLQVPNIKCSLL